MTKKIDRSIDPEEIQYVDYLLCGVPVTKYFGRIWTLEGYKFFNQMKSREELSQWFSDSQIDDLYLSVGFGENEVFTDTDIDNRYFPIQDFSEES